MILEKSSKLSNTIIPSLRVEHCKCLIHCSGKTIVFWRLELGLDLKNNTTATSIKGARIN